MFFFFLVFDRQRGIRGARGMTHRLDVDAAEDFLPCETEKAYDGEVSAPSSLRQSSVELFACSWGRPMPADEAESLIDRHRHMR